MDFDSSKVPELPEMMRRKDWPVGAALMERWLNGKAYVRQSRDSRIEKEVDTAIVKFGWAIKFHAGFKGYMDLLADRIWATDKAQSEIKSMLERNKVLGDSPAIFGDASSNDPVAQDKDYINHKTVTAEYPLTDLSAALANFQYRILVYGRVWPDGPATKGEAGASRRYIVKIEQVGVYIFDSYDFIDDQPNETQNLGYWDLSDDAVGVTGLSGSHVTNKTFQNYRAKSGKGCDFLVFSDLKRWTLPTPEIFSIVSSYAPAAPPNPSLVVPKSPHRKMIPTGTPTHSNAGTKIYDVREGDTLSGISDTFYGSYEFWPLIFEENRKAIGADPSRLRKATRLTIPPLRSFAPARIAEVRRRWRQEDHR